jgi:hypothetical protein
LSQADTPILFFTFFILIIQFNGLTYEKTKTPWPTLAAGHQRQSQGPAQWFPEQVDDGRY